MGAAYRRAMSGRGACPGRSGWVPRIACMNAQPASAYEPLLLLRVIRDVADGSGGADPQGISQRDWDAARAGPHASAPSARRITEYLGLPWAKVRELAFMNEPARARALGLALGEKDQDWLAPEKTTLAFQ